MPVQAYQEEVPKLYLRGKSLSLFLVEPVHVRGVVGRRFVAYRWKTSGKNRLPGYVEVCSLESRNDTQGHKHRHSWRESCSDCKQKEDSSAGDVCDSLASDLKVLALL